MRMRRRRAACDGVRGRPPLPVRLHAAAGARGRRPHARRRAAARVLRGAAGRRPGRHGRPARACGGPARALHAALGPRAGAPDPGGPGGRAGRRAARPAGRGGGAEPGGAPARRRARPGGRAGNRSGGCRRRTRHRLGRGGGQPRRCALLAAARPGRCLALRRAVLAQRALSPLAHLAWLDRGRLVSMAVPCGAAAQCAPCRLTEAVGACLRRAVPAGRWCGTLGRLHMGRARARQARASACWRPARRATCGPRSSRRTWRCALLTS